MAGFWEFSNGSTQKNLKTYVGCMILCEISWKHIPENFNCLLGWFKNPVSSQTEKLTAGTKFSKAL